MIDAITAFSTYYTHTKVDREGASYLSFQDKIYIGAKILRNKRQKELNALLAQQEKIDLQIAELEALLEEAVGK